MKRKVDRNARIRQNSSASMFAMRVENLTIVSRQLRFQFHAELTMSQIIEAFARNLIDKIMLEAFDVIDTNDGKLLLSRSRQYLINLFF